MRDLFKQKDHRVAYFLYLLLFIVIIALILDSLGFKRDSPSVNDITNISSVQASINGSNYETIELPHTFTNLTPGDKLTIHTTVSPDTYDGVYIKSPYAYAKVFLNGEENFEFGKSENYPRFMKEPAKEIHIIEPYGDGTKKDLRVEYICPNSITSMKIEPFQVGTSKEILLDRSTKYGLSMIFAFAEIIAGLALIIISICILLIDKKGVLYFWLGIFAFFSGSWFFGTNDFAITIFPHSTFLYLSAYVGFLSFAPALIQFILTGGEFTVGKYLRAVEYTSLVLAIGSLCLQLMGIITLHKWQRLFQGYFLVMILIVTVLIIYEAYKYDMFQAKILVIPLIILAFSSTLDIAVKLYGTYRFSFSPAQIGSLCFMLIMALYTGRSIKVNVDISRQKHELSLKEKMLKIQTREQRESNLLLVEHEKLLRQQRHDLRHHLVAIQNLAGDKNPRLNSYLDTLLQRIPQPKAHFCENSIVNSMISYFDNICIDENIQFKYQLVVPETNSQDIDSDLCVVFANLIENATEACMRMEEGSKFINIRSKIHNGFLVISMENSYDGKPLVEGDLFYSTKRDGLGIGLSSIKSIAESYHGSARFTSGETVFTSQVYMNIN